MKLNALAPFFGCKRQLADRIVALLGPHTAYWEPFCGSMAVLLAKTPCRMEVVNDLNGSVINLARVVADDDLSVQLFDRLNRTAFCQSIYDFSRDWMEQHVGHLHPSLSLAYHYFVVSWQGRNGLVGTKAEGGSGFCKRHTSGGGDPAVRFRNVVANIPTWWQRLRGVTILAEDGIDLCGLIEDREGTVVYADPPYVEKTATYKYDFDALDHIRLAGHLASKANRLVCQAMQAVTPNMRDARCVVETGMQVRVKRCFGAVTADRALERIERHDVAGALPD